MLGTDNAQKVINLLLVLEVADLFLVAVKLHDQIGQRGENALAGKAAFAHRNTLVHARYHGKRNVIPPIYKKAVQIEGASADAARTDLPTAFSIFQQRGFVNARGTERIRFEQHFPSPHDTDKLQPADQMERPAAQFNNQAVFFALCRLVARMNRNSMSAANTMPIGYATAVL